MIFSPNPSSGFDKPLCRVHLVTPDSRDPVANWTGIVNSKLACYVMATSVAILRVRGAIVIH